MQNLLKFYQDIYAIKHKEREGWKRIGVKGVTDTIASHSFGAALIGWVLAKRAGVDENRVIKTLLIHDLIMSHIEDMIPTKKEYSSKREMENAAAERLLERVPSEIKEEFEELFNEYQDEKTDLAQFMRECDKFDTLFQALMYSKELEEDRLTEFLEAYKDKFKSEIGKKVFEELRKEAEKQSEK